MQKFIELFTQVIEFWILYLIIIVHFTGINKFEILFLLSINSSELIALLPLIRGGKMKFKLYYYKSFEKSIHEKLIVCVVLLMKHKMKILYHVM